MIAEGKSIEDQVEKSPPCIPPCESCGAVRSSSLYCPACATLTIPPNGTSNHFAILGLPIANEIDPAELARRYLDLARAIHPDRMARTEFARDAVRAAALLNEARRTLEAPYARADYLLLLHGGKRSDEDKSVPPELLAETLELREEIDDARDQENIEALDAIRENVRIAASENLKVIGEWAAKLPGNEADRNRLRTALNAQRYYERLIEYVDGKQEL